MTDSAIQELLSAPELVSLPHLGLLHYLLSQSGSKHVAHCLDLDLVAGADSREKAASKLDGLVKAHIELALATGQLRTLPRRPHKSFGTNLLTAHGLS
jgi:hypothetical protein